MHGVDRILSYDFINRNLRFFSKIKKYIPLRQLSLTPYMAEQSCQQINGRVDKYKNFNPVSLSF